MNGNHYFYTYSLFSYGLSYYSSDNYAFFLEEFQAYLVQNQFHVWVAFPVRRTCLQIEHLNGKSSQMSRSVVSVLKAIFRALSNEYSAVNFFLHRFSAETIQVSTKGTCRHKALEVCHG